jgi:hypothetical protein
MFKCPKCKQKYGGKFELMDHMIRTSGCNYSYWIAYEIVEKQEEKLKSKSK